MPTQRAIEILDSMFNNFKEMGSGLCLDLQMMEITKRLQLLREHVRWSSHTNSQ